MKSIVLLVFVSIISVESFAKGVAEKFNVTAVRVDQSGKGYVVFDRDLIGQPAECITTYTNSLAFNTSTPGGQAILSLALAAKASGSPIKAVGTGKCDAYGVMEDWSYGFIY
ncbi:hypothetical protein [Endozoicomonas sp. ALD040]|uniref:hypothetical protein n=1 Tax=Endozoicomonas sp. ALD040 TaxID=3403079 RepID=UPI003BAF3216